MFKSVFFDNWFDDVFKDMDDVFKDVDNFDSAKPSTYTLKLIPDKEKGYNINYKADDENGKLDITAEGSNIDECVNNLIDNLKAETIKKEDESIDEKLLSLKKENQKLKESNEELLRTIDNLTAENIELQDMNDDLVISINQIASTVDKVNTWLSEV